MDQIIDNIMNINENWLLLMGFATFLTVFIIKKNEYVSAKYLPIVAPIVGIIWGLIATYVTKNDMIYGAIDGFLAGILAAGGKDFLTTVSAIFTGKIKDFDDVEDILDDGILNDSNKKDELDK